MRRACLAVLLVLSSLALPGCGLYGLTCGSIGILCVMFSGECCPDNRAGLGITA